MLVWKGKPIAALTQADIVDVPNALLIGMLKFHCRHSCAKDLVEQQAMVIAEAKRREIHHYALQQLAPSPCHCGRPGFYVVGRRTFCDRHKHEATGLRVSRRDEVYEPAARDAEIANRDVDAAIKRRVQAKYLDRRRKPKA